MARSLKLDQKSRIELVEDARGLGVERPERLTRVELVDEIVRRTTPASEQAEARGLFGVARSMLASVVESGLNLPEAASVIRGQVTPRVPLTNQAPVATVTLAEIYAAQGHRARALRMIEEVLVVEPDHQEALRVQRDLQSGLEQPVAKTSPAPLGAPQPIVPATVSPVVHAPVQAALTQEYVPAGFVETIGEEVETGKPPLAIDLADPEAPGTAETQELEEVSGVMEKPSGTDHGPVTNLGAQVPALVIHATESGVRLYWELPDSVLEQCAVDLAEGEACLRVVAITPAGPRPQRQEQTFFLNEGERIDVHSGVLTVDHLGAVSAVRAALGWLAGDAFLPICVAKTWSRIQGDPSHGELAVRAAPHLRV